MPKSSNYYKIVCEAKCLELTYNRKDLFLFANSQNNADFRKEDSVMIIRAYGHFTLKHRLSSDYSSYNFEPHWVTIWE